jgi:DNA adenine methylase
MADFMRRSRGKVMVSTNDHPGCRRLFDGFRFETMGICYCYSNQRQGKAEVRGELVIMN